MRPLRCIPLMSVIPRHGSVCCLPSPIVRRHCDGVFHGFAIRDAMSLFRGICGRSRGRAGIDRRQCGRLPIGISVPRAIEDNQYMAQVKSHESRHLNQPGAGINNRVQE